MAQLEDLKSGIEVRGIIAQQAASSQDTGHGIRHGATHPTDQGFRADTPVRCFPPDRC